MSATPAKNPRQSDRHALLAAFAAGLRPRRVVSPSEWGRNEFIVPVGPRKGDRLDLTLTPYLVEPLDMLRADSPHTVVAVKKSAQTGFSTLGLVWLLCLIDTAPDDMMVVLPTITAARDFNEERLDPAIKASRAVRRKVRPQRSRSGEGSTTLSKRFAGGRLVLTGANSATDLSSKTVRYAIADEVDRWPHDLDGQGDPMGMLDARQIAFSRTGSSKKLVISTPTNTGASRIDAYFEAGDQRRWMMPCPHCGTRIEYLPARMRGAEEAPYKAHYWAQCCGVMIESWQQHGMVLAGAWEAVKPGLGRHPSYALNALASLLTSWDKYWEEKLKSIGDPAAEKTFANLWNGESFQSTGSEVDPAEIARRAEDFPRGIVPRPVGRLVFAADTQDDRFEWALWGFGLSAAGHAVEQWLLDSGVISGDMHTDAPWDELEATSRRLWPHVAGEPRMADLCGLDTGGHFTSRGYTFVHRKSRWRALKGSAFRDAIPLSSPKRMEVKNSFGRLLFRVPLFFVGTFDLKVYVAHALKAVETGAVLPGGLRLSREVADEPYVEQLASEVLTLRERRDGRAVQEWVRFRRNEALDLAVYARALAFGAHPNGLGVDRINPARWADILSERHGLAEPGPDLFTPQGAAPPAAAAARPKPKLTMAEALARINQ